MRQEYKYTQEVLKYIRFKYDRFDIGQELDEHIEDMLSENEEMTEEEQEKFIIENMGDPKEVGEELDKEHKPLLGWIWRISRFLMIVLIILNLPNALNIAFMAGDAVLTSIQGYQIDKSQVECSIKTHITGKIDDTHIIIDGVDKLKDGRVMVKYRTWNNPFGKAAAWTFSINCFYDEEGNKYFGGGGSNGGFVSYSTERIADNSDGEVLSEHEALVIDYDYNGRKFYAKIPLKWEGSK